ncbi:MAG: class I SAM-dependent methyltransferase [Proteobacteria bacterium]|nr:class I SAM-dependent methyltransferase [Pseudomonadota bacterium]
MSMLADIPRVEMEPSPWVRRFADLIPENGVVLDLACGAGRHARYFLSLGFQVVLLDRNITAVADLAADEHVELIACDLEDGRPWPLGERRFDGVLITNYLYRPFMKSIVSAVAPGGVLIYETFAQGNQAFGRPSNPDFLLQREELLNFARPQLQVVAFEDIVVDAPKPAAVQHIAAVRANG